MPVLRGLLAPLSAPLSLYSTSLSLYSAAAALSLSPSRFRSWRSASILSSSALAGPTSRPTPASLVPAPYLFVQAVPLAPQLLFVFFFGVPEGPATQKHWLLSPASRGPANQHSPSHAALLYQAK